MSEQPYLKNGVERLRHRMEVLDGSPLMTVPPEVIREVLTRLEHAEQAVARVRELATEATNALLRMNIRSDGHYLSQAILEALDGEPNE